jgi:hypothetical protein
MRFKDFWFTDWIALALLIVGVVVKSIFTESEQATNLLALAVGYCFVWVICRLWGRRFGSNI